MSDVLTWKPVYKLFHWGIASCIVLDMFWLEDDPHAWAGYLALAFVILRISSEYFVKTPNYANAVAKTVYFSVWFFVGALAITGWLLGTDEYWGDENLQTIHEYFSNGLMGLIVVHLAGLLRNGFQRQNTWKKMFPDFVSKR